jgi:hypothetical protein
MSVFHGAIVAGRVVLHYHVVRLALYPCQILVHWRSVYIAVAPLSLDVWIYTAMAYLGVSVELFILARY